MKTSIFFCTIFLIVFEVVAKQTTPSVVIIGGGSAGIAAISRLLENNFQNTIILEAENRIGGRINTVFFGEAFIDLGAQICHGQNNNIVYDLVKNFDILKNVSGPNSAYRSSSSSSSQLDNEFVKNMIEIMLEGFDDDQIIDENLRNESIGSYYSQEFNNSIYRNFWNDSRKLEDAKLFKSVLQDMHQSMDSSFSWFDVALVNDYKVATGNQALGWNGFGYQTILDILLRKFPNPSKQLPHYGRILLNKEVTRIVWKNSTTAKVEIECSDGSKFKCDHAIFTPSLGVLKATHTNLFSPALPEEKQQAIGQIAIDAMITISIYFKTKWWQDPKSTGFVFVWTEEDKLTATKQFAEGPINENYRWITNIYNFIIPESNPNVLTTWFTGPMVPQVELIPDDLLIRGLMYVFNKFMGEKYKILEPDNIVRSYWYSNPHFRGTYTYQTLSTPKGNNSAEYQLLKPLIADNGRPVVLFAGEATHPTSFATVHGAIETGYREADRIIELYQ